MERADAEQNDIRGGILRVGSVAEVQEEAWQSEMTVSRLGGLSEIDEE